MADKTEIKTADGSINSNYQLHTKWQMALSLSICIPRTDLSELNYMTMCIKEAIRLHSVVPFIMRELKEDIVIDGKLIPKGHTMSIPIYSLHHNPLVWDNSMVKYTDYQAISYLNCLWNIFIDLNFLQFRDTGMAQVA